MKQLPGGHRAPGTLLTSPLSSATTAPLVQNQGGTTKLPQKDVGTGVFSQSDPYITARLTNEHWTY